MLNAVSDENSLLILDIGCADGFLARELQKRGHTVIGVEGDHDAAEKAKKYCKHVHVVDLNGNFPVLKEKYDVILFGDIIEHLLDGKKVLEHFAQYAKKDAQILLSTVNIAHLWIRLNLLCGRFQYEEKGILDKTHTHLYTWKSWRNLAKECGLRITQTCQGLICSPYPLAKASGFMGSHYNWHVCGIANCALKCGVLNSQFAIKKEYVIPVPLPLVWKGFAPGKPFFFLHTVNYWVTKCWKTMFGFQMILDCRK